MTIHELKVQAVIIDEQQQAHTKGGTDNTITSQNTYIGSIDTDAF